ncbi:MAG: dTDP-4-dehydrorhamnose reductase [Synechococcales cyanobacterium C42_A2020_086]|jgi:dTDP-4-dehydrorhamnose reductase|nr:dTDP-4-dehydrorhamnose reductase [Synechococcales cyanobacterium C42_A2020_086]
MTRILLIGQDGQVGQELLKTLPALGSVRGVGRQIIDLTQPEQIRQGIRDCQPQLIVNAAAYTAVDRAETEIAMANAVNADAPTVMAEEAQRLGVPLIHISTDYVFDGSKNTPYRELDETNPLSVYGQSKLAGELGIQQVHASGPEFPYAIVRTAWVYGTSGKGNFVKTMLRLGAEREEVRVVADQVGTPTWSTEIAKAMTHLARALLLPPEMPNGAEKPTLSGIYHFTNSGVTSWYDFAVAIFEEAQALGFPLKLQRVVPITTAEYPTPAQRPAYSVLATQKIQSLLPAPIPQWRQSLRLMLTELYSSTYESTHSLRR